MGLVGDMILLFLFTIIIFLSLYIQTIADIFSGGAFTGWDWKKSTIFIFALIGFGYVALQIKKDTGGAKK